MLVVTKKHLSTSRSAMLADIGIPDRLRKPPRLSHMTTIELRKSPIIGVDGLREVLDTIAKARERTAPAEIESLNKNVVGVSGDPTPKLLDEMKRDVVTVNNHVKMDR